jgi:hypothetical protein
MLSDRVMRRVLVFVAALRGDPTELRAEALVAALNAAPGRVERGDRMVRPLTLTNRRRASTRASAPKMPNSQPSEPDGRPT